MIYFVTYLQAPLGVYLKDENKLEDIVDILGELQKYAPSKSETTDVPIPNTTEVMSLKEIAFHRLRFGGDQLTAKRARAGVCTRNNSINSADCLEGLLPVAEDWHAKVVFLEVSSSQLTVISINLYVFSLTFLRLFGRDCTNPHQLQMLELFSNCVISSIGKTLETSHQKMSMHLKIFSIY